MKDYRVTRTQIWMVSGKDPEDALDGVARVLLSASSVRSPWPHLVEETVTAVEVLYETPETDENDAKEKTP